MKLTKEGYEDKTFTRIFGEKQMKINETLALVKVAQEKKEDSAVEVVEELEVEDEIFQVVELQPEFPGGMAALMKFLQENIEYPEICQKQGI